MRTGLGLLALNRKRGSGLGCETVELTLDTALVVCKSSQQFEMICTPRVSDSPVELEPEYLNLWCQFGRQFTEIQLHAIKTAATVSQAVMIIETLEEND